MSFFNQNAPRPDQKGPETERPARPDTSFLGDTNLLSGRPEPAPKPAFASEPRPANTTGGAAGATAPEKCSNVIAAGAKWQGSLVVEDSVRIDGVFSGEIQAKGTVHVADGAQVDAKVRGAFVVISGNFRGEIRCDQKVELLPRSRVNGEVITRILSVQEGAILDGRVQMTGSTENGVENGRLTRAERRGPDGEPVERERRERVPSASQNSNRADE